VSHNSTSADVPQIGQPIIEPIDDFTLRAETILFVEDEAFVRGVISEVLRSAGYRVLTAQNALEAAVAFERRAGAIDLLLTDVILPGENGRTLARSLAKKNPRLKILFVTGYGEQMNLLAAENGNHENSDYESLHCLPKPFSAGILLHRIRQLLDGREPSAAPLPVRRASGTA
jgi:two-component system, cell cycle sensor histidine kinase and response regulator CckA